MELTVVDGIDRLVAQQIAIGAGSKVGFVFFPAFFASWAKTAPNKTLFTTKEWAIPLNTRA